MSDYNYCYLKIITWLGRNWLVFLHERFIFLRLAFYSFPSILKFIDFTALHFCLKQIKVFNTCFLRSTSGSSPFDELLDWIKTKWITDIHGGEIKSNSPSWVGCHIDNYSINSNQTRGSKPIWSHEAYPHCKVIFVA